MNIQTFDCSNNPYGMAVDNSGNTYIAIFNSVNQTYVTNGTIQVISNEGISSIINLNETPWADNPTYSTLTMNPTGLAIDSSNNLYILNPVSSWGFNKYGFLSKYPLDNSANAIYNFLSYNDSGNGIYFTSQFQMTCWDNTLYFTGYNLNQTFIPYFNLLTSEPEGNSLQSYPVVLKYNSANSYITNDNSGNIYLSGNSRTQEGIIFWFNINDPTTINGVNYPEMYNYLPIYGITYDSFLNVIYFIYTDSGTGNSFIEIIDVLNMLDNTTIYNSLGIQAWSAPLNSTGGFIYNPKQQILYLTSHQYNNSTPSVSLYYNYLTNPWGMCSDNSGNIYTTVTPSTESSFITNGNLYVLTNEGTSYTIELGKTPWLDEPSFNTITINPCGITCDSNNNLYICTLTVGWQEGYYGIISKYCLDNSANSVYAFIVNGSGYEGFNISPFQITIYNDILYFSNGYYVVDDTYTNMNQIFYFDLNGPTNTVSNNTINNIPYLLQPNYYCWSITNDNSGNLYTITENGYNFCINKIDTNSGNISYYSLSSITSSSNFFSGITYLSNNLYFACFPLSTVGGSTIYYTSIDDLTNFNVLYSNSSSYLRGGLTNYNNSLYAGSQITATLEPFIETYNLTSDILSVISDVSLGPDGTVTITPLATTSESKSFTSPLVHTSTSTSSKTLYYLKIFVNNKESKQIGPVPTVFKIPLVKLKKKIKNKRKNFKVKVQPVVYNQITRTYTEGKLSNTIIVPKKKNRKQK